MKITKKSITTIISLLVILCGLYLGANISRLQNALAIYKQTNSLESAVDVFFEGSKGPLRELITELKPLECDINKNACLMKNSNILLEISPDPIIVLAEHKIVLKGKELKNIKQPIIKAVGLNMFMGLLIDDFKRENDEQISADVVFSACTEQTMRYRLHLLDGSQDTGIYLDIDVRR